EGDARAGPRARLRPRLRGPGLQGGLRSGDGADGQGHRERVPAGPARERDHEPAAHARGAGLLELRAAREHLGGLPRHEGVGAAGDLAFPPADGLRLHRGERAGVLPLLAVGPVEGAARRHGWRGRVREAARREGLGHARHGRPVAGAPVRGAVHRDGQRRAVEQAEDAVSPSQLGVWVAALLTLCIFSFLYKDNPFYKFPEHVFVGVSAGYYIVLNFWTVIVPNLCDPLYRAFTGHDPVTHAVVANAGGPFAASQGDYRGWFLLPALLGVLLFTRLAKRIEW